MAPLPEVMVINFYYISNHKYFNHNINKTKKIYLQNVAILIKHLCVNIWMKYYCHIYIHHSFELM